MQQIADIYYFYIYSISTSNANGSGDAMCISQGWQVYIFKGMLKGMRRDFF